MTRRGLAPLAGIVLLVALLGAGRSRAATTAIEARDFAFVPGAVSVIAGASVEWSFSGEPHTVTSGVPGAPDGRFDSGIVSAGGTYSMTFGEAGVFPYFCQVHPEDMTGTVTVVAPGTPTPAPTPTRPPTPRPTPPATPPPPDPATPAPTPTLTSPPDSPTPASTPVGPSAGPTADPSRSAVVADPRYGSPPDPPVGNAQDGTGTGGFAVVLIAIAAGTGALTLGLLFRRRRGRG